MSVLVSVGVWKVKSVGGGGETVFTTLQYIFYSLALVHENQNHSLAVHLVRTSRDTHIAYLTCLTPTSWVGSYYTGLKFTG